MNVVYNSKHYWIFSYPAQDSFELFDKDGLRTLFLQGPLAWHFRSAMEEIPATQRDEETIDAFLDDYCVGTSAPIVFH